MLIGEYTHTIDDKNRVSLPSKIRSLMGKKIVITPGLDQCLFVFTLKEWQGIAEKLSDLLSGIHHCTYHSTNGIVEFSKLISICDLFISGSTGPLHIAGALNIPTAAFYPAKRSATPLRWQTLNEENRRLAISPEQYSNEYDMRTINTKTSSKLITQLLGRTG